MSNRNGNRTAWMRIATFACCAIVCLALSFSAFAPSERQPGTTNPPSDPAIQAESATETPETAQDAQQDGVSQLAPESVQDEKTLTWSNGAPYRAEEVLVELSEGVTAADLNARIASLDFVETASIADEDVALGWTKLELAPDTDVADAISKLEAADVVASAQPNFVYHAMETDESQGAATVGAANGTSTPTAAGGLQAGGSIGLLASGGWQLEKIGAYDAWNTRKTNRSVTVAIIDSGCDVNHPELKANVVGARNVLDGTSNVSDSSGHGTHVAGIISANPADGNSISGVSYNARIMPIKIMTGSTTDTMYLVKAYDYLLANAKKYNVRVVNVSLGAESNSLDSDDEATLRAVDKAYFAGILSVFAAGNKESKSQKVPYYCFPCDFAETGVGVINLDKNYASSGKPASSSNYNKPGEKTKDLSAPGTDIDSTAPGSKYATMSGTSMATPVVSGVAALVFAQNPSLSAGDAKSVLCSTAYDIRAGGVGYDDYTGYGLVRADSAVLGASNSYIKGGDAVAMGSTLALSVPQSGTWTWSSSNPGIARVNASTGVVSGVNHGEAIISATKGSTTLYRTIVVYETKISGVNSLAIGQSKRLTAWSNPVAAWTYSSSNPNVATVESTNGVVTGKKVGTATITATLTAWPSIRVSKQVSVVKAQNPMVVKTTTKKVKYSKVKRKSQKVKNAITFKTKAAGTVTYAKVSKGSSKRLTINKKTGKITVKKGTKRGTYKIKVKVKAAGNASYLAKTTTVTVKIKVK